MSRPKEDSKPRRVFLFSGHMIDHPARPQPRFPADKEHVARRAIERKLDELNVGHDDLAMCGGACGGDLLFAEAVVARGARLEIRIPFDEPTFLARSVTFAGNHWRDRFYAVKSHENARMLVMPEVLGPCAEDTDPYARNNLWQLEEALAFGRLKVHFICLWNREKGDGPGGTQHMYDAVENISGQTHVLDTTKLW